MQVRCKCGSLVHFLNINVADATAKCPSCKTTFSTAPLVPGAPLAGAPVAEAPLDELSTGAGFDAIGGDLRLVDLRVPEAFTTGDGPSRDPGYREPAQPRETHQWIYRWFRALYRIHAPGLVFAAFFVTLSALSAIEEGAWWWALALLLPAAAVAYGTLAHLRNCSTITFNATTLVVESGPIPWQAFAWSRQEIAEFRSVRHGDASLPAFAERLRRLTIDLGAFDKNAFAVHVVDRAGLATTILSGMSEEEANYLVAELTRAL